MSDYPRLAIFIMLVVFTFQCIYATAMGLWLIAQFGFPVTSGILIFVIGYIALGFVAKMLAEIITLIGSIITLYFS